MDFNTYNISLVYMTHWIILSSGKAPLLNHISHCVCPLFFVCTSACLPPPLWFLTKGVSEPSTCYTSSFLRCHWDWVLKDTQMPVVCVYISFSALIEKNIINSNKKCFPLNLQYITQIALNWLHFHAEHIPCHFCSCGSVVEHCVSSAKGFGLNSHILTKKINV